MRLLTAIRTVISGSLALGAVLNGRITHVPEEGAVESSMPILNVNNYQSRITVNLYDLQSRPTYYKQVALVDENWMFKFPELSDGDYELIVQSVDFVFNEERYRIYVINDNIKVYEDPLWDEHRNSTIGKSIDILDIEITETKQYFEHALGSIHEMLLNSPLGFIFENRAYTIMFVLTLVLALFPYVLGFINPELAAEMREIQRGNTKVLEK